MVRRSATHIVILQFALICYTMLAVRYYIPRLLTVSISGAQGKATVCVLPLSSCENWRLLQLPPLKSLNSFRVSIDKLLLQYKCRLSPDSLGKFEQISTSTFQRLIKLQLPSSGNDSTLRPSQTQKDQHSVMS